MQIADLYIRVSTDEQADKGYSQRDQEERLQRYCGLMDIKVRKVIFEDFSAKTFNRPAWKELLADLRKTKGRHSDLVLFTKWDRFSRNAGDAYQMIALLKSYAIGVQAIDQPLDLSVPENKIMLAVYLATPEVENDRRALNVLQGMRRARKEGRWVSTAPIGYINKCDEWGKKYIEPHEPQASLVRWSFEKIAEGHFSSENIYWQAKKKGLSCVKANFFTMVRNPVYCGKIRIPKYKDEEANVVPGLHEPLISEYLFYKVQNMLDQRGRHKGVYRKRGTTLAAPEFLPLRGFLVCPVCGDHISGSPSKGRSRYYYYYHCKSKCGWRYKAEVVNDAFDKELERVGVKPGMEEVIKDFLVERYHQQVTAKTDGRKALVDQLSLWTDKLQKARTHLMNEVIDAADYRMIKTECDLQINQLESTLNKIRTKHKTPEGLIQQGVTTLSSLKTMWSTDDVERKRNIIGSIFIEKMSFDGSTFRTGRVNEGAKVMYQINKKLQNKKDWTKSKNFDLSSLVSPLEFEPIT